MYNVVLQLNTYICVWGPACYYNPIPQSPICPHPMMWEPRALNTPTVGTPPRPSHRAREPLNTQTVGTHSLKKRKLWEPKAVNKRKLWEPKALQ